MRRGWSSRLDAPRTATLALCALAGAVALAVATLVFPYRSINHDEAVYLQQAALLLDGRLFLRPPVEDAFRPWFFVGEGDRLYPKYAPIPAAVFALGRLAGGYPLALAAVAATTVGLTAALGRELFDARVGLLAGVMLVASPLFLVQSGVFLPYATTTALNLGFALAYLRAERRGSLAAAAAAGAVVGLAFFARPYTALLFALPFVAHACWTLGRSGAHRAVLPRTDDASGTPDRALVVRRLATAGLGTAGVATALGYNLLVTGDPLVFPYQAFAPRDGVGFGAREILGHQVEYTVRLALRSNVLVLRRLFADWVVAGPVGTALAVVGVAASARRTRERPRRALLAALFLTVPLGNVAFWGNFNLLGSLASPTDGLIHYLGPYYHYDLLVPVAVFGANGALLVGGRVRHAVGSRAPPAHARRVALAALVVSATAFGAVAATTAAEPLARNDRASDELAAAYAPVADGGSDDAVVFLPTPYGPWLNHPFQALRNDPGFDGPTVYALGGTNELAVAEAYPSRSLFRYVYAGTWAPTDDSTVEAAVVPVDRVAGERLELDATVPVPSGARDVTLRVATDGGAAYYVASPEAGALPVTLVVDDGAVRASGAGVSPVANGTDRLTVGGRDEVTVEIHVTTGASAGVTYRLALPVEREGGTLRALSPTRERCAVPTRCVPVGVGGGAGGFEATLSNGTA
ncbi:DUF7846 domain-containing protein [Candidatus Halobonum tyrrellensis]|uniref:DUF7846 domain-containing protein n=1 Tax=Candidatus Halobonum tyrrellensis G22 TaxID=1324957 RepID=V4HPI9_9EURY|nr:glycosyltransferase family 39 protein [Candidatus Halobonum tyrrellensis]ESP89809.1 hypothetical protein K933_02461 [Candidatus Halobonum tyrrellensis G22]